MTAIEERARGTLRRARIRLGGTLIVLGAKLHLGLVDLAVAIEPRLYEERPVRRPRPVLGLIIIFVLAAGLAFVGEQALWLVREVAPPNRGGGAVKTTVTEIHRKEVFAFIPREMLNRIVAESVATTAGVDLNDKAVQFDVQFEEASQASAYVTGKQARVKIVVDLAPEVPT